jgi:hypothetical protein
MQDLFPEYQQRTPREYKVAWGKGLFVFDTNVLLNLYRYQANTRNELLTILSNLAPRIWIPHHVALEFQRNRLGVIAEQQRRFTEVRQAISKTRDTLLTELRLLQLQKRHSSIDPDPLITGFDQLSSSFILKLDELQLQQQSYAEADPLKERLDTLFFNRVGTKPNGQDEVNELYKEAEKRYRGKIPPGYKDANKDSSESDEHLHAGIVYKRKYADFLIWLQILDHARKNSLKNVIFITDDAKDDWWSKLHIDGPKTIGPRPELIEEASSRASIDILLMYNPEGFLKYARDFLKSSVSENTLKEVREVSAQQSLPTNSDQYALLDDRARKAVRTWIINRGGYDRFQYGQNFPDVITTIGNSRNGYEIKIVSRLAVLPSLLQRTLNHSANLIHGGSVTELIIVIVITDLSILEGAISLAKVELGRSQLANVKIVFGSCNLQVDNGVFEPIEEVASWSE